MIRITPLLKSNWWIIPLASKINTISGFMVYGQTFFSILEGSLNRLKTNFAWLSSSRAKTGHPLSYSPWKPQGYTSERSCARGRRPEECYCNTSSQRRPCCLKWKKQVQTEIFPLKKKNSKKYWKKNNLKIFFSHRGLFLINVTSLFHIWLCGFHNWFKTIIMYQKWPRKGCWEILTAEMNNISKECMRKMEGILNLNINIRKKPYIWIEKYFTYSGTSLGDGAQCVRGPCREGPHRRQSVDPPSGQPSFWGDARPLQAHGGRSWHRLPPLRPAERARAPRAQYPRRRDFSESWPPRSCRPSRSWLAHRVATWAHLEFKY